MTRTRTYKEGTVVDLADDVTVVTTRLAALHGAYVNVTTSAHPVPIVDNDGAMVITIPASTLAGSFTDFLGIQMKGITVDPDNDAIGSINVVWAPLLE